MKPAPFEYFRPQSLDEALSLLADHGADAKPLAGGQSLIPAMNFRLATPSVLVDLNGLPELSYIKDDGGHVMSRRRASARSSGHSRVGSVTVTRNDEHTACAIAIAPIAAALSTARPAAEFRVMLG